MLAIAQTSAVCRSSSRTQPHRLTATSPRDHGGGDRQRQHRGRRRVAGERQYQRRSRCRPPSIPPTPRATPTAQATMASPVSVESSACSRRRCWCTSDSNAGVGAAHAAPNVWRPPLGQPSGREFRGGGDPVTLPAPCTISERSDRPGTRRALPLDASVSTQLRTAIRCNAVGRRLPSQRPEATPSPKRQPMEGNVHRNGVADRWPLLSGPAMLGWTEGERWLDQSCVAPGSVSNSLVGVGRR
jgi:hypothetical protein